jgi:hypothetical protein
VVGFVIAWFAVGLLVLMAWGIMQIGKWRQPFDHAQGLELVERLSAC